MKQNNQLNMAVVSDIHLGHARTPSEDIARNLIAEFPDNAETGSLDIIFLAGDVYDHLLNLPQDSVADIDMWIVYMLRLCAKHDILLRVLEGTPSHDWRQSKRFILLEAALNTGVDLLYVSKLEIEHIERFGIDVLYVPDEWQPDVEQTYAEVLELMKARGLQKVDYAIMHGAFDYQLPYVSKDQKHDSQKYLAIVKELIFIGHVHTHSSFDRIHAQGSFDRLSHGQEEAKGHLRAKVRAGGKRSIVFVENKNAKSYVTIDCSSLELEDAVQHVDRRVSGLVDGSNVRIVAKADSPIMSSMEVLIRRYPLFRWTRDIKDTDQKNSIEEDQEEQEYSFTPIALTPENLSGLLMERIAKLGPSKEVLASAHEQLEELCNGTVQRAF